MLEEKTRQAPTIGNYLLGRTLGEGTFGKVKAATHIPTNEPVAVKILEKSRIIDVADVERVSREIHILKLVRHPSIIQLYEIIETPRHLFLVMEYVTNGELFDHIVESKKLPELEACRIFQQIIAGVEYIHKLNVVHRDLKPENLLIDFDSSLKVVDFGLSNIYRKNEMLGTACGSPCYASPEMIRGNKYSGLTTDIWSAGVILFAMVCGYLPFEDPNTSELYDKIKSGKYKLPKDVSENFKHLLSKVLEVDPDKRYRIEDIRNHKWWNQHTQKGNQAGIMVGYDRIPVDLEVLSKLKALGHDIDHAQRSIQANRHNSVTTAYYLLLKKSRKNGSQSQADICSPNFNARLLIPLKKKQRVKTVACDPDQQLEDDITKRHISRKLRTSLSKNPGGSDANLGRSSTNETEHPKAENKIIAEEISVNIIPQRNMRYAGIKIRKPFALKENHYSHQRSITAEDDSYTQLISRHYQDRYRKSLVSRSKEKDLCVRSTSKKPSQPKTWKINQSLLLNPTQINSRLSKLRTSLHHTSKNQRSLLKSNVTTTKSSQKAYSSYSRHHY